MQRDREHQRKKNNVMNEEDEDEGEKDEDENENYFHFMVVAKENVLYKSTFKCLSYLYFYITTTTTTIGIDQIVLGQEDFNKIGSGI
ncbi:hypothetical protein BLA29_013021 [Euroglyphus maynei]|uniref:Uncharacterized protein n=1 Tax=Euroglyphus maynei TaxID=6958 RepID=A0A1Y3BH70_EURMA|nr:hypothetical protein BLA29_013021 [Euroglyphus maynei]